MDITNDKDFNQIDEDFIKAMELADATCINNLSKSNLFFAQKLVDESNVLRGRDLKTFQESDYQLIDKMVAFCQSTLRDENSVKIVLGALLGIYDRLITRSIKKLGADEELRSAAQTVFCRMITSDMPLTIKAYESTDVGMKARTLNMHIDLSDKRVPKIKRDFENGLKSIVELMTDYGLSGKQLENIMAMMRYESRHSHEIIPLREKNLTLEQFTANLLHHEMMTARAVAKFGSTLDNRNSFSRRASAIEEILNSPDNLRTYIDANLDFFKENFKDYQKAAYRNRCFKKTKGMNFTNYINKYLPLALIDILRSRVYVAAHGGRHQEISHTDKEIELKGISTIKNSDSLISYFEENHLDRDIAIRTLTPREQEVFQLLLNGYNQKEVATQLDISEARISQHRKKIKEKLSKYLA
ncbi:MAG: sigma-70 family RNA polymerase sigma factor [bacterium]|nr:sigma-70 family RNA polymerase sigma factor [bacterium]